MTVRTAKVAIVAIRLVCPHCQQAISAPDGTQTIHADMADRWAEVASHKQVCKRCFKPYWLPANPFSK